MPGVKNLLPNMSTSYAGKFKFWRHRGGVGEANRQELEAMIAQFKVGSASSLSSSSAATGDSLQIGRKAQDFGISMGSSFCEIAPKPEHHFFQA